MKDIEYVKGDATAPIGPPGNRIIVHVCNDVGGWGLGFVLAISKRWGEPEAAYREWAASYQTGYMRLGAVQYVQVEDDLWVANLIGQHKIGRPKDGTGVPPIRYEAVRTGLSRIAKRAATLGASVHMPRIGCGLAGGTWEEMELIIVEQLSAHDIPVTVYDYEPPAKKRKAPLPRGTPHPRQPPRQRGYEQE